MKKRSSQPLFLPTTLKEKEALEIDTFDIILLSGDAYVDHPSFATAILGRSLWDAGYTVGVIAQPKWVDSQDFSQLGAPKLFFSLSAGNLDSMVSHYTAAKKKRSRDLYTPGGEQGYRPDRATLVYADIVHRLYPKTPIVIGGIEASLRRFAHYDFWSDRVRGSILADAPADILVYGMGEQQLSAIASEIQNGIPVQEITDVPGTVIKERISDYRNQSPENDVILPSLDEVRTDKRAFADAYLLSQNEQDPIRGRRVVQAHPKTVIIQNPPALPLRPDQLDTLYELPYTRCEHPSYHAPVPALEPVRFSITAHRGCFGSCSFCALTHHQGRIVQSRSTASVLREVHTLTKMPEFRGTITDIGGPTATMYMSTCSRWKTLGTCQDSICTTCPSLTSGIDEYLSLLSAVAQVPGVKHVFIGSGIRHDLIPDDPRILIDICRYVSGHLKIAPEHVTPRVLAIMHKSGEGSLDLFRRNFLEVQKGKTSRQYLVPYFMSGHPGCTLADMLELALYMRDTGLYSEQVQDFTPTPMTSSTCMYYTGYDPFTKNLVHIPKGREKVLQRALLQFRDPDKSHLVREALISLGRKDLIGDGWQCLVPKNRSYVSDAKRKKGSDSDKR